MNTTNKPYVVGTKTESEELNAKVQRWREDFKRVERMLTRADVTAIGRDVLQHSDAYCNVVMVQNMGSDWSRIPGRYRVQQQYHGVQLGSTKACSLW